MKQLQLEVFMSKLFEFEAEIKKVQDIDGAYIAHKLVHCIQNNLVKL